MEITDADDPGERDIAQCGGCGADLGPEDGIDQCQECEVASALNRWAEQNEDRGHWNGCYED